MQCQINMNLVFHIFEAGSEIENYAHFWKKLEKNWKKMGKIVTS